MEEILNTKHDERFLQRAINLSDDKMITLGDMASVNQSGYYADAPWKVLIHGFLQHKNSFFPRAVKDGKYACLDL